MDVGGDVKGEEEKTVILSKQPKRHQRENNKFDWSPDAKQYMQGAESSQAGE